MRLNSNRERTFIEEIYLPEMIRGLAVTMRHFVTNILNQKDMVTLQYPEQKAEMDERFRGRHRLNKNEDGTLKCTACMLCATACMADCINIEAEETADGEIEKRAKIFEIDLLRCIFCGYCVEACPCDSIYMDTGIYAMASLDRTDSIIDIAKLSGKISEDERERN